MEIEEVEAMNRTAELWNCLLSMTFNHTDDLPDLKFHIHAIQNIILARVGQRVYNVKVCNSEVKPFTTEEIENIVKKANKHFANWHNELR